MSWKREKKDHARENPLVTYQKDQEPTMGAIILLSNPLAEGNPNLLLKPQ